MTASALLAGAIVAFLVWGLHLPLVLALILTAMFMLLVGGRILSTSRATRKVVIIQDMDTGKTEYQAMDAQTRAYIRSRARNQNGGSN